MKITFLRTSQDRYTQHERYTRGMQADIRGDLARVLVGRGDAVEGWGRLASEKPQPSQAAEIVEIVDAQPVAPIEDDQDDDGEAPDLESMTVVELRELAVEHDINGYSTMRKSELIEALEAIYG